MDKPIPEALREALVRLRQIAGMVEYSINDVTMTSQEAVAIVEQALSTQTANSGPIPKAILERVARAIAEVNGADPAGWQFYQADATVAIEALTAAQQQGQAVACDRCGDSKQEFNWNGDGPYPCRHCHTPQPMQQGGGEAEFKERVADMLPRGTTISDPEVVAERLMRAHAASFTTPPSAPVGTRCNRPNVACAWPECGRDCRHIATQHQEPTT